MDTPFYVEVPFLTADSFHTTFPPQLTGVINPAQYVRVIESINGCINQVKFGLVSKAWIASCIIATVVLLIMGIAAETWYLYVAIAPALCILFFWGMGLQFQALHRRVVLQAELVAINQWLHESFNPTTCRPISIRLYLPPVKQLRVEVDVNVDDNSLSLFDEPYASSAKRNWLFAHRRLYIEVGPSPPQEKVLVNESGEKVVQMSQPAVISPLAVDIPLDLALVSGKYGVRFNAEYDRIYPAPLTNIISRTDFQRMIDAINLQIRQVKFRSGFVVAIGVSVLGLIAGTIAISINKELNTNTAMSLTTVALLFAAGISILGAVWKRLSDLRRTALLAVMQMNDIPLITHNSLYRITTLVLPPHPVLLSNDARNPEIAEMVMTAPSFMIVCHPRNSYEATGDSEHIIADVAGDMLTQAMLPAIASQAAASCTIM